MRPPRRHRRLGDPGPLPRVPARRPGRAAGRGRPPQRPGRPLARAPPGPARQRLRDARSATDRAGRRPRRPRPRVRSRPDGSSEALECYDVAFEAEPRRPGRRPAGRRCGRATRGAVPEPAGEVPWWSPRVPADFGGSPRPHIGSAPSVRSAAFATPWTTDRIAVERAHLLRRLRRWDDAADAWASLAAGPGRTAIVAAIELAKLREHRLRDPLGALRATRRRPRPRRAAARARPAGAAPGGRPASPAPDACDDGSSGGPRPSARRGRPAADAGRGPRPAQRDRTWSSAGSNEQAIVRRSPASALR